MTEISPAELVESTLQKSFQTPEERNRWVRNNRSVLGISALAGLAVGFVAGHTGVDQSERSANAEDLDQAASYERCVDFIEQRLKPGDKTITLKLGSLARRQQIDCGIGGLAERMENTRTNRFDEVVWEVGGSVSALGAEVTLPTTAEYEAKIADLKDDADYSNLRVGIETSIYTASGAMGGLFLGMLARGGTLRNARRRNANTRIIDASEQVVDHAQVTDEPVIIGQSALTVALGHIRVEKEAAFDTQDWEAVASWRDNEKAIMAALGGHGLARPEED